MTRTGTAPALATLAALAVSTLLGCGGNVSGGRADASSDGSADGGAPGDGATADGATGGPEVCDGVDNDGDGATDEDFDLLGDIAHCGSCQPCADHAFTTEGCSAGECTVLGCDPGHMDRNGRAEDGCEFACDASACEACDGVDNDCDGEVDEGCGPVPGCSWNGLGGSANPGGVSNAGNAGPPAVAVDSRGAIYLAWAEGPVGSSQIYVHRYDDLAACGPTAWQPVGGAVSSGIGGHLDPAITIGADDLPIVAWRQSVGGYSVYVRRWNGSNWVAMGASDSGWGVSTACASGYSGAQSVDIALDPVVGEPIVAWSEDLGANSDVLIRGFDGAAWQEMGLDSAGGTNCFLGFPRGVSADATPSELPRIRVDATGTPYVAWMNVAIDGFGNPLENAFVKRFNGTAWQAVAGSAGGSGVSGDPLAPLGDVRSLYPDLALVDDRPLVAWLSLPPVNAPTIGFDTYVRTFDGARWGPYPAGSDWLNGVSDLGGNISGVQRLAVRPGGRPVIAYSGFDEIASQPGNKSGIFVRQFTGSIWRRAGERQDGGAPIVGSSSEAPALAVDVWDRVVLAYRESGDVLVRRCANTAPVLDAADQLDGATSLAVGAGIGGTQVTISATLSDANGDDVRLAAEVRPIGDSLSGRPTHVSALFASGSAVSLPIGALGRSAYHWRARAVDAHGFESPWLSFGGNAEGEADFEVTSAAPLWRPMGSSASGAGISGAGHNFWSRVALDGSGRPVVVWHHQSGGNPPLGGTFIHAKRWNGSAWTEMGGSATGNGLGAAGWSSQPSIVADGSGEPIVAWSYVSGVGCGDPLQAARNVYVKRWSGSAWVEMGAGSATGAGISGDTGCGTYTNKNSAPAIALLDTGEPFVAWQHDPENGNIFVKRFDGTGWVAMGAGSASGTGISGSPPGSYTGHPHAFSDPVQGTPFVTWTQESPSAIVQGAEEAHQVYVKKFNGSAWVPVAPGSASGEGIDANDGVSSTPTGGAGTTASTQHVWIAFADTTSGSYEVYVMRSSGGGAFAGVGSVSGNVSANSDTSYWPWLAVTPDGQQATVAWSDAGSGIRDIWVRRWSGAAWLEVGAGSFGASDEIGSSGVSGGVAPSGTPSLVLGAAGDPFLTWTDSARGNLGSIFVRGFSAP